MLDDWFKSVTTLEQRKLEQRISKIYFKFISANDNQKQKLLTLQRDQHIQFLLESLDDLPEWATVLDASGPWISYWVTHGLALLGVDLPQGDKQGVINFIRSCEHPQGGYAGGPQQIPHLAPTYAAVATLVTIGGENALNSMNKEKIYKFLQKMCVKEGGFLVYEGGEIDARGCYCAMAVCKLLCFEKDKVKQLLEKSNMVKFLEDCQTYEGGLAGEPGAEAHGGYAFCALAALALSGVYDQINTTNNTNYKGVNLKDEDLNAHDDGSTSQEQQKSSKNENNEGDIDQNKVHVLDSFGEQINLNNNNNVNLDLNLVMEWALRNQGEIEGGFRGRTNKLVDGCYSYWMGALFPLLHSLGVQKPGKIQQRTQKISLNQKNLEFFQNFEVQGQSPVQILREQEKITNEKSQNLQKDVKNVFEQNESVSYQEMMKDDDLKTKVKLLEQFDKKCELIKEDLKACESSAFEIIQQHTNQNPSSPSKFQLFSFLNQNIQTNEQNVENTQYQKENTNVNSNNDNIIYNSLGLQIWLLLCSQVASGGFVDKPGKSVDWYHTCYCLSGLSVAQNFSALIVPFEENKLEKIELMCNIVQTKFDAAQQYFMGQNQTS